MVSPSRSTGPDLLVLHTLRCIGSAGAGRVAEACGLPEPDAESELIDLAVAGLVTHERGQFGGWSVTATGRIADAERISAELDAAGARGTATRAYEHFLVLNPELLDLCTAWQMRALDGVVAANDHTDRAYDARLLDLFAEFDGRADAACAELCAAVPRFRRYRTRLTRALTRARSGEPDELTDSMTAYHTVWFQLHEDLLVTLGIPRH